MDVNSIVGQKTSQFRPVVYGEVLFDRFPDRAVLGGAPFNVAWHLQGFGCNPLFISRIGNDDPGGQILQAMQDWGFDTTGLQTDSRFPTGGVVIKMSGTEHSFNILPDQAYDDIDPEQSRNVLHKVTPSLFYHGSLIIRTKKGRRALDDLLTSLSCPVFVDINLRDPWWRAEDLTPILHRSRWVKVNDEELEIIGELNNLNAPSLERLARNFKQKYSIKILIVTRGGEGAFALESEGDIFHVQPEEDIEIVDTVGAGDAFSAVVLLGLQDGWPLATTLQRAQDFASRICRQRGAIIPDIEMYGMILKKWNESK